MFVHMSLHYPRRGQEQFIIESMKRYEAVMKGKPGHRRVHILRDSKTGNLIGMAFWDSRADWEAAGLGVHPAHLVSEPIARAHSQS